MAPNSSPSFFLSGSAEMRALPSASSTGLSTQRLAGFILNGSEASSCGLCLWMGGLLSGDGEFISAYK